MKSPKNKTIDLTVAEGAEFLSRCVPVIPGAILSPEEVENRIFMGDAFDAMASFPKGFADLMIVDPPYNLNKDFHGEKFTRRGEEAYREYTRSWLIPTLPLLKPTASVYVCCDWQSSLIIGSVLQEHLYVQNRITWQREKGRGAGHNWKNSMEDIWFATCSKDYKFNIDAVKQRKRVIAPYRVDGAPKDWQETSSGNFRDTCPSNFWDDISVPYWSMAENTAHPTQKPEKLLAKLILASSDPEDMVFDPFLGSGSTAVTAKKLGRRFCGIEKNEQYCVWAQKRLTMAEADPTIQGYTDGVFWERNSSALQKRAEASSRKKL